MNGLMQMIENFKQVTATQFSSFGLSTVVDLIIVSYLFYSVIYLIKDTRAVQLMKGIILLIVMLELSDILKLETTYYVLKNSMQVGLIAILIVFQPELRRALEQFGRGRFGALRLLHLDDGQAVKNTIAAIDTVCEACEILSSKKTGALIVFERTTKIGDIVASGTIIDAEISTELILNIFFTNSPLHDGALVIRGTRLLGAGCFLPLTQNNDLNKDLGTRHRAAIGISENSDAIAVVVSEETGYISTANGGNITRGYNKNELKRELQRQLLEPENKKEGSFLRRLWPRKK